MCKREEALLSTVTFHKSALAAVGIICLVFVGSFGCGGESARDGSTCEEGYVGESCDIPVCEPECLNGGLCVAPDTCDCSEAGGYTGASCEDFQCEPECLNGGLCVAPNTCDCSEAGGYTGASCEDFQCEPECLNGGLCVAPNTCDCSEAGGYTGPICEDYICEPNCGLHGTCIAPNECRCDPEYFGPSCELARWNCANGVCLDLANNLEWQQSPTGNFLNLDGAGLHCQDLNLDGGSWRLPVIGELRSLISGCSVTETGGECNVPLDPNGNSCLDVSCQNWSCNGCAHGEGPAGCYRPEVLGGSCGTYFSSSLAEDLANTSWQVNFNNAGVLAGGTGNMLLVRCVRQPSAGLNEECEPDQPEICESDLVCFDDREGVYRCQEPLSPGESCNPMIAGVCRDHLVCFEDDGAHVCQDYGEGALCDNTCIWAMDGDCDDGGPGHFSDACAYGTDCADCGVRF